MTDVQTELSSILNKLKSRQYLPKKMDVCKVGNRYWFVCYDNYKNDLISDSSTTGFADEGSIALLKALSERFERLAFRSGYKAEVRSCMTERSDGFAAFPKFYENAEGKARQSALAEAIERYVWANWWDDETVSFKINNLAQFENEYELSTYVSVIRDQCDLEEVFVIEPEFKNFENYSVFILFGRLKNGGYISGGACGPIDGIKQSLLRSLDELYRHGLAIKKSVSESVKPSSFYEKRLIYFGMGHGNHLVVKRLSAKGNRAIVLPQLEIDEPVYHELNDLFQVHRCYFKDQPPFIGGEMERLCL